MSLQESGEMYLETILVLSKEKNEVRSIDVANEMGFSKPSVSRAMSKLREEKYILMDKEGFIALTEKGRDVAEKIYERHVLLTMFLKRLGLSDEVASADACRIEHVISDETFEAMKRHASAGNAKILT